MHGNWPEFSSLFSAPEFILGIRKPPFTLNFASPEFFLGSRNSIIFLLISLKVKYHKILFIALSRASLRRKDFIFFRDISLRSSFCILCDFE